MAPSRPTASRAQANRPVQYLEPASRGRSDIHCPAPESLAPKFVGRAIDKELTSSRSAAPRPRSCLNEQRGGRGLDQFHGRVQFCQFGQGWRPLSLPCAEREALRYCSGAVRKAQMCSEMLQCCGRAMERCPRGVLHNVSGSRASAAAAKKGGGRWR